MHIGLVGAGRMGALHAEVLASQDGVETLTVADADAARAHELAEAIGGRAVRTAEDLVAAGVDALVIAAATPAHAPLIELGAESGLPTFCEKPIALDLAATDRAVRAAQRAGIYLQMGFQRRFDPGFRAAYDAVSSGSLGQLVMLRCAMYDPAPPAAEYLRVSGGVFRDMHIHDFDCVRFVTQQEVEEVYADGSALGEEQIAELGDLSTTALVLRLSGGTMCVLAGSRRNALGYDVRLELLGTNDAISVGLVPRAPLRGVEPGCPLDGRNGFGFFMDRFQEAYRAQMAAFADAVQRGAGPSESPCTGEDAEAALRVAVAAERSLAERRPVRVNEVDMSSDVRAAVQAGASA